MPHEFSIYMWKNNLAWYAWVVVRDQKLEEQIKYKENFWEGQRRCVLINVALSDKTNFAVPDWRCSTYNFLQASFFVDSDSADSIKLWEFTNQLFLWFFGETRTWAINIHYPCISLINSSFELFPGPKFNFAFHFPKRNDKKNNEIIFRADKFLLVCFSEFNFNFDEKFLLQTTLCERFGRRAKFRGSQ